MLTKLSVNLNKIALIRNSRDGNTPSPTLFAQVALKAGAAGITVHPRPDERHIRADDVPALARLVSRWPGREFNIEGNPFMNLMEHARACKPHQLTFVPDSEEQKTSDHGFDLTKSADDLRPLIKEAHDLGCRVSLFMDPNPEQMALAKELGADRVELYTESYAAACGTFEEDAVLAKYATAAKAAHEAGLGINAGHDLSLTNLYKLLVACENIAEVSIGHALISEALEYGMTETVGRYNGICLEAFDAINAKSGK
ncbi:MAG: pyridoxine 5'-phosphate synthase [Sutterellaceae bacterium]|nr:pyridoxine 5'-phosphate synthase [Sutterellaceae bacterium]